MYKLFLPLLLFACAACTGGKKHNEKKEKKAQKESAADAMFGRYNLNDYTKIVLPQELDEISGIAYNPATQQLIAVNDEDGILFFLDPATGAVTNRIQFAGKGDYEEVFFGNGCVWILESKGRFLKVFLKDKSAYASQPVPMNVTGNEEFEAAWLCADSVRVATACKKCGGEAAFFARSDSGATGRYRFEQREIDFSSITNPAEKLKFHASAAGVDPADKRVYLVASPDKKIIQMTQEGKVLAIASLNPAVFKQPEGICFTPDGTMYISNEAAGGNANLLVFKPQNQPQ
jgi:uncharacterized protein YjiK